MLTESTDADKGCWQPRKWQAYLVWGPRACDVPTLWAGSQAATCVLRVPLRWPSRK